MPDPKLAAKQWDVNFEEELLQVWEREPGLYAYNPDRGPTYVIDTPPPYPSGDWHPGAVVAYALIDMIARSQRMLGKAVVFPFGLDRNGINIERTVEKKHGKRLHQWDRQEFIDKCREEITAIGDGILRIAKRMGMTADFGHAYYTDSDAYRAFSQAIFIDLFNRGLFYRGERPGFYCVACETPLAEADIVHEEVPSKLAWVRFPLTEGGEVTIATTRPELLPACRAVIVHPDDERWRGAAGKTATVPLFGHEVPVRAHPEARMDFGSGAAMICSYGDLVDVRLFRELQLDPVKAIDERGRMTAAAGPYAGLRVDPAREAVLKDLESKGALEKVQSILHKTPLCERSRTPVEFLLTEAWYLKQLEFRPALERVVGEMAFHPPRHRQLLLDWIASLTIDWPVSRHRYYHTEIPLWTCGKCKLVLVPKPGPYYRPWRDAAPWEECPNCSATEFVGETRVFDTWMDSSCSNLWVTRYGKDEAFFEENFPTHLRTQGREIVRTWLYYTTLKSWLVKGEKPFQHVFIHGLGLDARGRAMHRTTGNYLPADPLIQKFGADAIRFFAASETGPGDDYRISEDKIGGAQKFITKLWNVARFISSFPAIPAGKLKASDEWILAELNALIVECRGAYEEYNLFVPANRCREFLWNTFAPHYVEMVKGRAYQGDDGAVYGLHATLRDLLRLLAPIVPFSTDKIWREVYGGSVHGELLPSLRAGVREELTKATPGIQAFNSDTWKRKREAGISLGQPIEGIAVPEALKDFADDLKRMHRLP